MSQYSSVGIDNVRLEKGLKNRFLGIKAKKKIKEFQIKMRKYKHPDFNRMILDLQRLGWTHEKISFVLPVANASTVSEWARGGTPNFENGEAFIELWRSETGVEKVPRVGEMRTYQYEIGQLDLL